MTELWLVIICSKPTKRPGTMWRGNVSKYIGANILRLKGKEDGGGLNWFSKNIISSDSRQIFFIRYEGGLKGPKMDSVHLYLMQFYIENFGLNTRFHTYNKCFGKIRCFEVKKCDPPPYVSNSTLWMINGPTPCALICLGWGFSLENSFTLVYWRRECCYPFKI